MKMVGIGSKLASNMEVEVACTFSANGPWWYVGAVEINSKVPTSPPSLLALPLMSRRLLLFLMNWMVRREETLEYVVFREPWTVQ
jgi:hypothetical protein